MKALVLHENSMSHTASALQNMPASKPTYRISIDDVPKPQLKHGEVLVRMRAAALNHRDEWIRKGQYAAIRPGVILGSDGCGVVEEVAADADKNLLGKEVVINPSLNWGDNPRVQSRDYTILGLPVNGTFAEFCAVPAKNVSPKPNHLNAMEAAAVPLAGLTAYRAVRTHGEIGEGRKVLITGIGGGVAQFAAQFAVALGASVYATSGSDEKLETAQERLHLKGGANYRNPDWEKHLLKEAGEFDCIIDSAVGKGLDALLGMLAMGGRYVFFGATAGLPSTLNARQIFWRQLRLQGSTMGNDAEFEAMLRFIEEKHIVPLVDSVRPFGDIVSAFDAMAESQQLGKLVVSFA